MTDLSGGCGMKMFAVILVAAALYSCTPRQAINSDGIGEVATNCSFSSDKGESFHDAVVVNGATNQREGLAAEYRYISDIHGRRGLDWFLVGQTVISDRNKVVDVVEIQLNNPADRKVIYFDATSFLMR